MNQIESQFEITRTWFEAISNAVGNQKLDIIRQCANTNDIGWEMLQVYMDPYQVFHIGPKSLISDVAPSDEHIDDARVLCATLSSQKGITNALLAIIKSTLGSIQNPITRAFAADFITKTIKIGVTSTSINKAIGRAVIPTLGCMLANKYFDNPKAIIGKHIAVTEKLDGIRALTFVSIASTGIAVSMYSRQGQAITGLVDVEEAIRNIANKLVKPDQAPYSIVLDGELLVTDRNKIPSKEQYKQTIKIVRTDNRRKTGITYHIFDCVHATDFREGFCKLPYITRREYLQALMSDNQSDALTIVPIINTFFAVDQATANEYIVSLVTNARNSGQEGIMLNDCAAPYICKRTNYLLKVKVFQDCDLQIVGFQEGTGKFANTLGALIVEYKGSRVGVGSGLSDEQRNEFWNNQAVYLNRIATIQYFEETCDASGTLSIRFPVFLHLREEDKEVSYS